MVGRVAVLRLCGIYGNLDICVCYFDARCSTQRQQAATQMAAYVQNPLKSLSMIMGDFNFVEKNEDRITKATGVYSGSSNASEAKHFQDVFLKPHFLRNGNKTSILARLRVHVHALTAST